MFKSIGDTFCWVEEKEIEIYLMIIKDIQYESLCVGIVTYFIHRKRECFAASNCDIEPNWVLFSETVINSNIRNNVKYIMKER